MEVFNTLLSWVFVACIGMFGLCVVLHMLIPCIEVLSGMLTFVGRCVESFTAWRQR